VTYEDAKNPRAWHWEIKRHGKSLGVKLTGSLGVKLTGGAYQSQAATEFAGQREFQRFITDLIQEEKRKR
jgi:hypothetical protein